MLHGLSSLTWLPKPLKCPVCHQVYLPDQGSSPKAQAGSACRHAAPFLEFTWWFGFVSSCWWWHRAGAKIKDFLTLKFLPVQDRENLTFLLFWCQESRVIWWSIVLAPLASGWCSQRGGGEVEKRRSLSVLWHFQALHKEDRMCLSMTVWM